MLKSLGSRRHVAFFVTSRVYPIYFMFDPNVERSLLDSCVRGFEYLRVCIWVISPIFDKRLYLTLFDLHGYHFVSVYSHLKERYVNSFQIFVWLP